MLKKSWTFCIRTFGCKVNQYESHSIREAWVSFKGKEVRDVRDASTILLNTCAVTANAVADVRQAVAKIYSEAPSSKIIITGCSAELIKNQLDPCVAESVLFIAQKNKERLLKNPCVENLEDQTFSPSKFPSFSIKSFYRSRPIVKIQDGCSYRCSYCIIPSSRGKPSSRSADECLKEIRTLLQAGYREVVLSGVNLRQYGDPQRGFKTFWDLLLYINQNLAPEWENAARIRISSLDPAQFTDYAFEVIAKSSMLCPQLHISIQSGSKKILKDMRRERYAPEHIAKIAETLSTIWPIFGLGADIIAGFPGETKTFFKETLSLIRELPLTYAHIFPFSPRPGTLAATLPDQVDPAERRNRAQTLRKIIQKKQKNFYQKLLDLPTLHIAPENDKGLSGLDERYAPCVFSNPLKNKTLNIIKAKPLSVVSKGLLVEPIDS